DEPAPSAQRLLRRFLPGTRTRGRAGRRGRADLNTSPAISARQRATGRKHPRLEAASAAPRRPAHRCPHAQPSTNKELLYEAAESIPTSSLGGCGRRDRLTARTGGSPHRARKPQQMAAPKPASSRSPTPPTPPSQAK